MTREERITKLRSLPKAYILHSLFTKMPFIECEQGTFYDMAFLFETKEDAEEAAKRMNEGGDPVGITELKMLEMTPPSEDNKVVPIRKLMRSQVREHLTKFPLLGLNAVFFKPEGEAGEVLPLDEVLPDEVKEAVEKEKTDMIGVQLTGMYFAQYLRRKDREVQLMKERYEEFYVNLARTKLLLPIIPEEGHRDDASLNLTKCKLPVLTSDRAPGAPQTATGEQANDGQGDKAQIGALGLFTNMDETAVYSRSHLGEVRVVQVGIEELPNFLPEQVKYVVIDPLTISITLKLEDTIKVIQEING